MNGATYFSTVNLVTDTLTAEQVAHIVANESQLPGISTTNNWQRTILPTSLSSIIGTVTSEQAGLPAEDAEYYLSRATHQMTVWELPTSRNNMKKSCKVNVRKTNQSRQKWKCRKY